MTAELYRFAIANLTHGLDAQFGLPPKTTLSQRDVPGMTRGVVPILRSGER